jgi:alkanesulfonate monooxygenase SsuD/methylene tetrahydromethanopterin reductase-like flavin-dependent oxidoreductase (luciferase family)
MKLGVQLNSFDWSGGPERFGRNLADIGRVAEEAGFDRIGVADHLWQHPIMGGPEANEPECYTTLAFLAANTERIRLTAMVSGVHFRHPAVLIKAVSTLDVLSGGRACFGVGSGHYEEETQGLGILFPPQKERFEMLEETVRIALRMWSGERGDERPFEGKHYRLGRPLNLPQSISRPHPPIMIAGEGEQKTLRLVARYADACALGGVLLGVTALALGAGPSTDLNTMYHRVMLVGLVAVLTLLLTPAGRTAFRREA